MIWLKIVAVFAFHLAVVREIAGNPDAKRLYDDLLSNYNRLIRPVSNNTQTVLVKLGLRLSQLIDLVSVGPCKSRGMLSMFFAYIKSDLI